MWSRRRMKDHRSASHPPARSASTSAVRWICCSSRVRVPGLLQICAFAIALPHPHPPRFPSANKRAPCAQTCTHTSRASACKRLTVAGEVGSGAGQSTVVLTAMGSAINKCITVAEILKRRVAGLHQWNQIQSVMLEVSAPRSPCLPGAIYARNACCAGGRRTDNWLRGLGRNRWAAGRFRT